MILQQYPHLSVPRGLYVDVHVQPLIVEMNVVEIPESTYPVCSNETIDQFIEKVSVQQRRKKGKPVKAIKSLKQTKKEKLSKVARNTKKRKY
tara:strand:- start:2749 stop:3024 length:276 start_codon:yes stop_codon:yes gene_type:complete